MPHSQTWALSQEANKASGVCSVCFAVRQLHLKDGTVHKHGPRYKPCAGSGQAPLSGSHPATNSQHSSGPSASQTLPLATSSGQSASNQVSHSSLFHLLYTVGVIKHIPKSARSVCATFLSGLLRQVVTSPNDIQCWSTLLGCSKIVLAPPKRGGRRRNLGSTIKNRICSFSTDSLVDVIQSSGGAVHSKPKDAKALLSAAVSAKIEDGNIRAAVRILCSEDRPVINSADVVQKLEAKHPPVSSSRETLADPATTVPFQASEAEVLKALRSFPPGSSGGPDGFRPQHILDLVNSLEAGAELLGALTAFVNLLLSGTCHPEVTPLLFGGRLVALEKKSGGVRPIVIGSTFRRLAAKCANSYAQTKLANYFCPRQLGVGTPGGCEAAVHASRRFLESMPDDYVMVKIDFSNAFNSLHRDVMLQSAFDLVPEIYKFCHLAYSGSSVLRYGDFNILSHEGPQQGDPLGPLLFCGAVHHLLESLTSCLVIAFMDDFTLGGSLRAVEQDVVHLQKAAKAMGLHINVSKCEVIHSGQAVPSTSPLNDFLWISPQRACLLGAPITQGEALDAALSKCCDDLSRAVGRLQCIDAHEALVLLRASFSAPKIQYILRCVSCVDHPALTTFDDLLKGAICQISNLDLSYTQWLQASLPVREGGLGIRRTTSLALPAYLAAAASTCDLQDQILAGCHDVAEDHVAESLQLHWSRIHGTALPPVPASSKQCTWDKPVIAVDKATIQSQLGDAYEQARFSAVSAPHSGDWLHAIPISACGLKLEDDNLRVAVGLRLGCNLCEPHTCPCGTTVDARGAHGLSCKFAAGRQARHHTLNDILWRALCRANIPVVKEPSGLARSDGRRPDGLSLIPWQRGRSLIWDVTIVNSVAASYQQLSSATPGGAAENAATRKEAKYHDLAQVYIFQPIALETLGPLNSSAMDFIRDLGSRLTAATGDQRETAFLFQRLSMSVQRFNAVAFRGSFAGGPDDEE